MADDDNKKLSDLNQSNASASAAVPGKAAPSSTPASNQASTNKTTQPATAADPVKPNTTPDPTRADQGKPDPEVVEAPIEGTKEEVELLENAELRDEGVATDANGEPIPVHRMRNGKMYIKLARGKFSYVDVDEDGNKITKTGKAGDFVPMTRTQYEAFKGNVEFRK